MKFYLNVINCTRSTLGMVWSGNTISLEQKKKKSAGKKVENIDGIKCWRQKNEYELRSFNHLNKSKDGVRGISVYLIAINTPLLQIIGFFSHCNSLLFTASAGFVGKCKSSPFAVMLQCSVWSCRRQEYWVLLSKQWHWFWFGSHTKPIDSEFPNHTWFQGQ